MTIQTSVTVGNAQLDAIETAVGAAPILRVYTGAQPADCATAASGTLLIEMTLPSDWMAAASSRSKAKSGTWQDASANASGTIGHYRIYDSAGTTCHLQGSAGGPASGADLVFDADTVTSGQSVTITTYTWTGGNA